MAFTPQKLVHQQALVEVFGEGLYTELDFRNEAGRLQTLGGHVGSRFSLELLTIPHVPDRGSKLRGYRC